MKLQIRLTALLSLLITLWLGDFPTIPNSQLKISSVAVAETTADQKAVADNFKADQLLDEGTDLLFDHYRPDEALQSWQQALIIYREIKDRQGEGDALNNLGIAYYDLGQYTTAIEYCQQHLALAREIKDRRREGYALNILGRAYDSFGQYTTAIEYYQQSLAIAQQIKDRQGEGDALNNLGTAYGHLGQYTKAIDYYQQHLALAHEIKDRNNEGIALNHLGIAYVQLGDYTKAIDYYQQSLAIARKFKDREGEGSALGNLGNAYGHLGQYTKAIDYYQQLLVIAREFKNPQIEGYALNILGLALYKQGNLTLAEKSLLDSIQVANSLRSNLADTNKVSIFDTQTNPYITLQQVLIAQKKTQEALEIAERGRVAAFFDVSTSGLSLSFYSEALIQYLASNLFSSGLAINPPNIQQIQQTAKEQNATIIEYSNIYGESLYIWVIKPNGEITFRSVDLKSSNLTEFVENTRVATATSLGLSDDSALTNLVSDTRAAVGATDTKPSERCRRNKCVQQMYQLLIKPIADLLPTNSNDRVIFIPHQSLFLIPFAALQDEQGKYLIEKHTILTAPSIQVLQLTHSQRQKNKQSPLANITVVGNPIMPQYGLPGDRHQLPPLPGSEKEATNIAQILNTKPIIGAQATKAFVTQQMQQSNIIHLATHGLLNEVYKQGVIALTPAGDDDGLLSSSEILDLKLKADLVVLSACNTGRGKLTGDGIIGLSRSLISAGASSIIVSLWSVDDSSTSFLMSEFYQQIQQKPDKAQALRQAMLTTMKQYPEPKYWAAFTLMGESL